MDLSKEDYAIFLAKWASRVKHSHHRARDWKVFMVVPENKQLAVIYDRGQTDKNHIEIVNPEDCAISMRRPWPDPIITKIIHPAEETFIQQIPVDPNWNKPEDNFIRYL